MATLQCVCGRNFTFLLCKGQCSRTDRLGVLQGRCAYNAWLFKLEESIAALQQEHANSSSHQFVVERVSHHDATQPVNAQLSSQRAVQQSDARDCLQVIFTSIQYLARQGLPLRGHSDDDGNFKQLLHLQSTDQSCAAETMAETKIGNNDQPASAQQNFTVVCQCHCTFYCGRSPEGGPFLPHHGQYSGCQPERTTVRVPSLC